MTRHLALRAALAALLALPLAAPGAQPAAQADVQQVKQSFSTFFDAGTPLDQRVQLLQDGPQFKQVLERQARQPVARETSAAASAVRIDGDRAQITFHIDVGGHPMLQHQHGTMVKQDGRWKVSQDTFCRIESMRGLPPEGCSQP